MIFLLGAVTAIGVLLAVGDKPSQYSGQAARLAAQGQQEGAAAELQKPLGHEGSQQAAPLAHSVRDAELQERVTDNKAAAHDREQAIAALSMLQIDVKLSTSSKVETVPLEQYVRGVLAGEMPADFELEALKAQAIAARTYIVRRLALQADGPLLVSDTISDQVYISLGELERHWGSLSKQRLAQLSQAVEETAGVILTYDGEPIEAMFFSTSNGYTENSEDYFGNELPYLRSVSSPWDVNVSPRYKQTTLMKLKEFYARLGVKKGAEKQLRIEEYTDGRRVKRIKAGGKEFTGRQFRELLGLPSSQFTWRVKGGKLEFTTFGYGHGVGMSQWGAHAMAQSGRKAEEILAHYYSGARLEAANSWLPRLKG